MTDRVGYLVVGVAGDNPWEREIVLSAEMMDQLGEALQEDREFALRAILKPLVDRWIASRDADELQPLKPRVSLRVVPPSHEG